MAKKKKKVTSTLYYVYIDGIEQTPFSNRESAIRAAKDARKAGHKIRVVRSVKHWD